MAFHVLTCQQVQQKADAFADGELSLESTLATRAHLARCPACRRHARWQQALHDSTRRAVHRRFGVPPSFEHRVRAALEHERLDETSERVVPAPRRVRSYRALVIAVPLVALVLVLLVLNEPPATPSSAAVQAASAASPNAWIDGLVDAMIGQHAAPAPTQTRGEPFTELEREVGLPVHAPPELARRGATWLAARSIAIGDQRAAALAYRVAGHRCTLFLYDDARLPVRRSRYLAPKAVDRRPVFVGTRRGYAFAAVERRGLGYAIATDLDVDAAAQLAAAIR